MQFPHPEIPSTRTIIIVIQRFSTGNSGIKAHGILELDRTNPGAQPCQKHRMRLVNRPQSALFIIHLDCGKIIRYIIQERKILSDKRICIPPGHKQQHVHKPCSVFGGHQLDSIHQSIDLIFGQQRHRFCDSPHPLNRIPPDNFNVVLQGIPGHQFFKFFPKLSIRRRCQPLKLGQNFFKPADCIPLICRFRNKLRPDRLVHNLRTVHRFKTGRNSL